VPLTGSSCYLITDKLSRLIQQQRLCSVLDPHIDATVARWRAFRGLRALRNHLIGKVLQLPALRMAGHVAQLQALRRVLRRLHESVVRRKRSVSLQGGAAQHGAASAKVRVLRTLLRQVMTR
jgi:hypothetical protein